MTILLVVAGVILLLGVCAIGGCMLSSQNSRRLEQVQRRELEPPMASGF